ncbi:hypothetical protein [Arthrobacter sp. 7Tela_A1]|uniref:hypothetical protein n=1 Tax=Arthrobacter sp. 7Tela_A1 TaxID=3093745 RepID=UPI003BB544EE
MPEESEYIDVDAVVRMRKGERLADSKKTEGWSRGYTPKSTDKGPEHVEIRLKADGADAERDTGPAEPQIVFINEYVEPSRNTREQDELEELLGLLILLGIVKATAWVQPRLLRLWNERVIPFFTVKRGRWQERRALRKAGKQPTSSESTAVVQAMPVDGTSSVSNTLKAYQMDMTSVEARRHFTEALIAQRFANEKMRLLANARIEDGGLSPELATAVSALAPTQVENALDALLASTPTLLHDLENFIKTNPHEGQLQLGGAKLKAVLHLTNGQQR